MSDTITPNYGFHLPAVGASQDSWGNKLNGNWSSLDSLIHSLTVAAGGSGAAYLPLTGGTINGSLTVLGGMTVGGSMNVGASFGAVGATFRTVAVQDTLLLSASRLNDFAVYSNAPQRVWQWAGGVTDVYQEISGTRFWNFNGAIMSLDFAGNLQIAANAFKPGGGPWSSASDDRLKHDIKDYTAGLKEICRLAPISFKYNGLGGTRPDGVTYHGLSAQAARSVMPELVFEMARRRDGSADPALLPGQLGTQLGPLTLALVNSCKELTARVVALEARVVALEARCPG